MAHPTTRWFLLTATLALSAAPAAADASAANDAGCRWAVWSDPAPGGRRDFDPATGRSLLNFPPHPFADYRGLTLRIDIRDMQTPTLRAEAVYTLSPIGNALGTLRLNCGPNDLMSIGSVRLEGRDDVQVAFRQANETLEVTFNPPLPPKREARLAIDYTLTNPRLGLVWTPQDEAWPGRPAQIHTQGQPEMNRYWFPTHDFPNVRMATELYVTVPRGFEVSSNGRLVSRTGASGGLGLTDAGRYETFHWRQELPHAPYLVSLIVGKFDHRVLGRLPGGGPIEVFAPLGQGGGIERTFGRTGDMIAFFGRYLDEPYPWDRYAQLVVHNFSFGGMENTAATTLHDSTVLDERALLDGDRDGLVSHELAHQWFGDLLTCRSWEHIWLNEGFATYMSHLWFEHRDGADWMVWGLYNNRRGIIGADRAEAPIAAGMASRMYGDPDDVFRRPANPYPKGAFILHMLRRLVGDELFRASLVEYVNRHKLGLVETRDLRRAFEDVTGRSLERFFTQWVSRPGVPTLAVATRWDEATRSLVVTVNQRQTIDGANPAFWLTVPIWVRAAQGPWTKLELTTEVRSAERSFPLESPPLLVAVDPDMTLLADVDVAMDVRGAVALLKQGPTLASRLDAARLMHRYLNAASVEASTSAADALLTVVADEREFFGLRQAAAEELGAHGGAWELFARFGAALPRDARARAAVVRALAACGKDLQRPAEQRAGVLALLKRLITDDPSYGVRAAALGALGSFTTAEAGDAAVAALGQASQDDAVRQAALRALAELGDARTLERAVALTAPGVHSRTRAVAAQVMGRAFGAAPEAALRRLTELLDDPTLRVAQAAGESLAEVADPGCIRALEAWRDRAPTLSHRRKIETMLTHARRVTVR
ncbi:MAG: M1 family metallopeptidase [Phycisphaeraceae bacterium]|nr:M1 family metallopeptidase [Phycisphaeraceae bacterium]